jgi:hypothetical protein
MNDLTTAELDLIYELVRMEANRIRSEHGCIAEFEPGSWARTVLDLNRKLSAAVLHGWCPRYKV